MSIVTRGLGGPSLVTRGLGNPYEVDVEIIFYDGITDRTYLEDIRTVFALHRATSAATRDHAESVRAFQFWDRAYQEASRQLEQLLRDALPTTRHASEGDRTYSGGDRRYN